MVIRQHGTPDEVVRIELAKPIPKSKELLIRIKAAAVNPADLKVISGKDGGKFLHSSKRPIQLGFDYAGVVEEIGAEVTDYHPGDEVYGFLPYSSKTVQGSFSEFISIPESFVAKKPATIGFPEAAAMATAGLTAYQALVKIGKIAENQSVLINGASGGVGSMAVQIAVVMGAQVTATCGPHNMDFVASLGAERVVDYNKEPIELIDGSFDIIFDVAAASSWSKCKHLLNKKGMYITTIPDFGFIKDKLLSLFSSKKSMMVIVKPVASDFLQLKEWIDTGKLKMQLQQVFPISQLKDALYRMQQGHIRGKIAVSMEG